MEKFSTDERDLMQYQPCFKKHVYLFIYVFIYYFCKRAQSLSALFYLGESAGTFS